MRCRAARWCWLAFILMGGVGTVAKASAQATVVDSRPIAADPLVTVSTKLTPGCVILITVTDEPQLSTSYTVDAEGKIRLLLTDSTGINKEEWTVKIQGKTADEARSAIAQSLKMYLVAPEVHVVIARIPHLRVEVSGAVKQRGALELPQNARLADALTACVTKPTADLSGILIRRQPSAEPNAKTSGKGRIFAVDYAAFLRGDADDDTKLEQDDQIFVPEAPQPLVSPELKIIRVRGEVAREVTIPLGAAVHVKDAFDRAGGLKPTADREKILLIRGADGSYMELNADRVEGNDPVHNLNLGAGDLIIVGRRDQSQRFTVLGEVNDPRTFEWSPKEPMTLLRALEMAGGPTKKADLRKGVIKRGYLLNPTQTHDIYFDLDAIHKGRQSDWEIEAGDAIMLPPKQNRPTIWQQLLPFALHFLPF